jgi:hypothetical protein
MHLTRKASLKHTKRPFKTCLSFNVTQEYSLIEVGLEYITGPTMMVAKSSVNENKVFVMTLTKPSKSRPKILKSGRGVSFARKSGRGDVAWQHRGLWSLSPGFKSLPRPHRLWMRSIVFLYSAKPKLLVLPRHFNQVVEAFFKFVWAIASSIYVSDPDFLILSRKLLKVNPCQLIFFERS